MSRYTIIFLLASAATGTVGLDDFYYFQECLLGPGVDAGPGCRFADMNEDGTVDMSDFLAFQDTLVIPE